jgi:L-alanine-DL-glutamate epimerase-like enolase superfamily enzyme
VRIRSLEAFAFRVPVGTPVRTSFGVMHDRPAVFVRAEDDSGASGWGEVWCNFPSVGAEHRARLIDSVFAPLLAGREVESPQAGFRLLTEETAVLALQSAEPGPIAQCIAGIDIALWDLAARNAKQPLWRMLGGASPRVRAYASGLNPEAPAALAALRYAEGHRAFKPKIGFGEARDLANLRALRQTLGDEATLMADANQAWSLESALAAVRGLEEFDLGWLEEPLRADRPWREWRTLAQSTRIPLAAGENLAGEEKFDEAIGVGALRVMQPDAAKWGGISGCFPVAKKIVAAGLRYCPHFLGGGVGLLASAHLLAACGGNGLLEVDANPNPLRDELCGPLARVQDGACALGEEPGLGALPDPRDLPSLRP